MAKHNSGRHYLKIAEQKNAPMKRGKGDHVKVYAPPNSPWRGEHVSVIDSNRDLSVGTEHSIRKFFIKVGLLSGILLGLGLLLF